MNFAHYSIKFDPNFGQKVKKIDFSSVFVAPLVHFVDILTKNVSILCIGLNFMTWTSKN